MESWFSFLFVFTKSFYASYEVFEKDFCKFFGVVIFICFSVIYITAEEASSGVKSSFDGNQRC
jgi:hypothetical protein